MASPDELVDLERSGWEALSTSDDAAAAFYDERLVDRPLMLLPGGMVLDDRRTIVDSMSGTPWDRFELFDERVVVLSDDAAVVTYRASAVRGDQPYTALVSSTYVLQDGAWRMALHQQTPL